MNFLCARTRLAFGLASLVVSVLLLAMLLGLVPDRSDAVRYGRARLCEAVAVNASVFINEQNVPRAQAVLEVLVDRNEELLSAAIRRADGTLIVNVGDHPAHWQPTQDGHSTETQVQVPIRSQGAKWGRVELCFSPISASGFAGVFLNPWVKLIGFCAASSMVMFWIYLRAMLQHLDPAKAVPSRVRSALDNLAEGLAVLDKQGRIVLANRVFAQSTGQTAEALVGKSLAALPWIEKGNPATSNAPPWTGVLRGEEPPSTLMLGLRNQAGLERAFVVHCAPVLGNEEQIRGVLVSFEDVTLMEEQKTELANSKSAAEAANRAKSEFLANMSHEIRTPMNAILGFADILRRGYANTDAERREYLNTIHSSGRHLLLLINDILDLSKVESGRLESERIACSPHQIIAETVNVLRVRAQEKGLKLEYEAPEGLPESIQTDAVRLRQILTNLIGNSLKFTEAGSVRVIARTRRGRPGSKLVVEIVDTGIGMAPETLKRIFDPFTQADTSITRRFGGTGLGLTISRKFAEALGGQLTVTSKLGQGSTFTITVEAGSLDGVPLLDQVELTRRSAPAEVRTHLPVQLPPATVLLVDDGEENRRLIELVLRRAGLRVVIAQNGQLAVDAATQQPFDAILMDMQMPVMDGYTATQLLRERGVQVPIIALTANAMQGDEEKCREAGCTGFLPKPIDLDQLLLILSEALGGARAGSVPRMEERPSRADSAITPTLAAPTLAPQPPMPLNVSLDQRLNQMACAWALHDYQELVQLAETIQADARRAGQGALADLAARLIQFARANDADALEAALIDCDQYRRTPQPLIVPPDPQLAGPLVSTLPMDDLEFRDIVRGFVQHLSGEWKRMQAAWRQGHLEELARLAHWLKGAGGTMGFGAFHGPATRLEQAAKQANEDALTQAMAQIEQLVARIESPSPALETELFLNVCKDR